MPRESVFVLDTSALLAFRSDEPGAEEVQALLLRAKRNQGRLFLSFMTRLELFYCVWREEGEEAGREALRLVDSFAVEWVSCEPEILEVAARFKAQGGLSVADCWIGATAFVREAILIHKDPEFTKFKEIPQRSLAL